MVSSNLHLTPVKGVKSVRIRTGKPLSADYRLYEDVSTGRSWNRKELFRRKFWMTRTCFVHISLTAPLLTQQFLTLCQNYLEMSSILVYIGLKRDPFYMGTFVCTYYKDALIIYVLVYKF